MDALKNAEKELTTASHKIAEEMYKQASAKAQNSSGKPDDKSDSKKEDVVDAEYKVEDDK